MPFVARRRRAGVSGSNLKLRVPLGLAVTAAWLLSAAAVQAQQTVVIGGGPAPSGVLGGGTPGALGPVEGGIEVNDAVLDILGPGPTGAVPLPAPQSPVARAPLGTSGRAATGATALPGGTGAYRAPGSDELVVTRPSTLLYPPMESPRSRLTIAPTRRAQAPAQAAPTQAAPTQAAPTQAAPAQTTSTQTAPAQATSAQQAASGTGGKLKSRLIAAPPKQRAPEPAKSAAKPAAPKAPQKAAQAAAPAKPRLSEEIKAAEAPAVSGSIAPEPRPETASMPAPSAPAPQAPKAAAVAPPPPPSLTAPSAAAPSAPKAPEAPAPKAQAPKAQTVEAPPPVPADLLAAQPKAVQEAARTTGAAEVSGSGGKDLRLTFASGSAELSEAAKQELRGLAKGLAQDSSSRVQLLAYAADAGDGASRARRLSLSRALAVRAFLIDQGIRSTRMDVRALGSNAGDGPADRVDVLPQ